MTQATRYRMYVDESGDHVMEPSKWSSPDARYLGLTGVVMDSEVYRTRTHPEFEALKQEFFPHDPDEPVVLVRNRIIKKLGPFGELRDPELAAHWEQRIIRFLNNHASQIFTVVIDKQAHQGRTGSAASHPYHYCAAVLTERYGDWLRNAGATGDVMMESRGRREDMDFRAGFSRFMLGSLPETQESQRKTGSSLLRLKSKENNITGLQLADLVAYPSMRGILLENGFPLANPPSAATRQFIEAIQPKHGQNGKALLP